MLLILMYNQVAENNEKIEINLPKFTQHLQYLQKYFNFVVPGQNLLRHNICLTFDNAHVNFYHYIFPVLKSLNIPAVLGLPVGLIEDNSNIDIKQRLTIKSQETLNLTTNDKILPPPSSSLCSWKEIREMVATGLIYPASYSLSYKNLATINFNEAYQELCVSKRILSVKLENVSEILIYPFGNYTKNIQAMAKSHYHYIMGIGNASNSNWEQKILYRIDATQFWQNNKPFSKLDFLKWKIKFFLNQLSLK